MHEAAGETDPVTLTTTLRAKPGREDALELALHRLAEAVAREEPGCLIYQPVRSRHQATRFLLLERYRDEQALFAHANSAHFRAALAGLMDCLEQPPEVAVYDELGRSRAAAERAGRAEDEPVREG